MEALKKGTNNIKSERRQERVRLSLERFLCRRSAQVWNLAEVVEMQLKEKDRAT